MIIDGHESEMALGCSFLILPRRMPLMATATYIEASGAYDIAPRRLQQAMASAMPLIPPSFMIKPLIMCYATAGFSPAAMP